MSEVEMMDPGEIARVVWMEIDKLRKEIPPPDPVTHRYPDNQAARAFQAADQAVASLCAVPRERMLEGFTELVDGHRLNDLLDALVSSGEHPALQHSCLMVMCGVASLKKAHDIIADRDDVLKSLINTLGAPKSCRISPEGAEEDLDVNPAVGAAICLNSLLVSCGGLTEGTIKTWVELNGLEAITSALESHGVFEGGGDEDVLPAMLFGLATPLLIHMKDREAQTSVRRGNVDGPSKRKPRAKKSAKNDGPKVAPLSAADKAKFDATRLRLANAFLKLLAERRQWVARSLSMATSASSSGASNAATGTPPAVNVNNLFVNSLAHPDLLGKFTSKAPVRLRALAISAARECQNDGTFAPGFANQLARLSGLAGQAEERRRIAGMVQGGGKK